MRSIAVITLVSLLMIACNSKEEHLRRRAAELCQYIPDHELLERSKDFMTTDFYTVLDTMFNHLPEHEAMDHEWLYYFVTGNGGTIADYEVTEVTQTDETHAVATIKVQQKWEDGSFDESSDIEEHKLYMEKVDGLWLMSDFDKHKQDCIRHIKISRREQVRREAMIEYLIKEIGTHYQKGEVCIPTLTIIAEEEVNSTQERIWCDCWVNWYNVADDTLKMVSGGNHSGCMMLEQKNGRLIVTAFEQTVDGAGYMISAQQIFGQHYDIYQNTHSNHEVYEAVRKEQLQEYVRKHKSGIRYYQDYDHEAVEL